MICKLTTGRKPAPVTLRRQPGWLRALLLFNLLAVLSAHLLWSAREAASQPRALSENELKAAWCARFLKGTYWPTGAFHSETSPLVLGILGNDPFGGVLDGITNKVIRNQKVDRRVVLKRVQKVEEAKDCHLLFVSPAEEGRLAEVLNESLKNSNILTVGETEVFARLGGIVTITLNKKQVFEINAKAMQRAGLSIDSQLMECGKVVR